MIYFAIFTGCLIAAALSIFIYSHLRNARLEKEKQQKIIDQHLIEHKERQEYITESIKVIIKALDSDQVKTVEASIRLKVLIDQLKPMLPENSFPIIEQVFDKTKHIPKLKAWKALEKKDRKQYTKDIELIEKEFTSQVIEETKVLATMMKERADKE